MIVKPFIHQRHRDRAAGAILVFAVLMLVVMVGMSLYRFKRMEQDLKLQTAIADQRSASFAVEYVYQEAIKALEYGFRSERSLATSFPIDGSIYTYVFTNKSSETCSGCFDLTLSREFSSAELDLNPGLPERAAIRIECDGQCGLRCGSTDTACLLSSANYQPSRITGRVMAYRNESLESMDFNILVEKGSIFQPGVVLHRNFEGSDNLTGPIYLPASLDSYEAHIYSSFSDACDSASDYADRFLDVWTRMNHSLHCDDSWTISGITWTDKTSLPLFHRSKYDYSEFVSDYGVTSRLLDHFLEIYHKPRAKSPYDLALDDDDDVVDGADLAILLGEFHSCSSSSSPCKDDSGVCKCCACDFNNDGEISGTQSPDTLDVYELVENWGTVPSPLPDEDVLWDFTKVHLQKTDFHENNPESPHLVNFQNNLKTWTDAEIISALFSDPPEEGSGPGADPLVYLQYELSSVDFMNILVGLGLASKNYDVKAAVYSIPSSMTYENVCVTTPGTLPYPKYGDADETIDYWIEYITPDEGDVRPSWLHVSACTGSCKIEISCNSSGVLVYEVTGTWPAGPVAATGGFSYPGNQIVVLFDEKVEVTEASFCSNAGSGTLTVVSAEDIRISSAIIPEGLIGATDDAWTFEKLRERVRSYPQKLAFISGGDIILDIKAMRAIKVKDKLIGLSGGTDFLGTISLEESGFLSGLVMAQLAAVNDIKVPLATETIIEETIPLLISGPVVADQIVSHRLAHDSSLCLNLGSPILIDLGVPVSDSTKAPKAPPLEGAFHLREIHKVIGSASN